MLIPDSKFVYKLKAQKVIKFSPHRATSKLKRQRLNRGSYRGLLLLSHSAFPGNVQASFKETINLVSESETSQFARRRVRSITKLPQPKSLEHLGHTKM